LIGGLTFKPHREVEPFLLLAYLTSYHVGLNA